MLTATVDRYNELCDKGIDKDWQPIPHLFAAGNTVGWRLGCGYQMTIPGMCNGYALFHGYVAGRYAADENFDWDQLEA